MRSHNSFVLRAGNSKKRAALNAADITGISTMGNTLLGFRDTTMTYNFQSFIYYVLESVLGVTGLGRVRDSTCWPTRSDEHLGRRLPEVGFYF